MKAFVLAVSVDRVLIVTLKLQRELPCIHFTTCVLSAILWVVEKETCSMHVSRSSADFVIEKNFRMKSTRTWYGLQTVLCQVKTCAVEEVEGGWC